MSIEIRTYKGRDGWQAKSSIPLRDDMFLNIRTCKSHQGGWLVTYVSACTVRDGFETHRVYQDFSIVANKTTGRATENSIFELHNNTLQDIDDIKAQALAHYQKEEAHA